MQVHILSPFSTEKNLGKAYNESISLIPDNDWACLTDLDINFLTSDAGNILYEYAKRSPSAGILTCFTNRVSTLSKAQLLTGNVCEIADYKHHILLAKKQQALLYHMTEIQGDISGMLMMISKRIWNEHKFSEEHKCLGVDTNYSRRIRAAGKLILRMDGLYVFHGYRFLNGIYDKSHLL